MTHEPESVDLSPLDPERDPARWAALMDATRVRVAAALLERRREPDPLEVMSGWARPILAAAAGLLLLLGAAATMLGSPSAPAPSDTRQLARLSEAALLHGRMPTGAELRQTLDRGTAP